MDWGWAGLGTRSVKSERTTKCVIVIRCACVCVSVCGCLIRCACLSVSLFFSTFHMAFGARSAKQLTGNYGKRRLICQLHTVYS